MKRPSRRTLLLASPLLVMLGLTGLLKWRSEHPPVSRTDALFQAKMGAAPYVFISGEEPGWHTLIGLAPPDEEAPSPLGLMVKDKAALRELAALLRCKDQWVAGNPTTTMKQIISLGVPSYNARTGKYTHTWFVYERDATRSRLVLSDGTTPQGHDAIVQPRFAQRFEDLIARLGHQATAKEAPSHAAQSHGAQPHAARPPETQSQITLRPFYEFFYAHTD